MGDQSGKRQGYFHWGLGCTPLEGQLPWGCLPIAALARCWWVSQNPLSPYTPLWSPFIKSSSKSSSMWFLFPSKILSDPQNSRLHEIGIVDRNKSFQGRASRDPGETRTYSQLEDTSYAPPTTYLRWDVFTPFSLFLHAGETESFCFLNARLVAALSRKVRRLDLHIPDGKVRTSWEWSGLGSQSASALWPSSVPGQGVTLGNSTTDILEYLNRHALPASDRKTNENSVNSKKCLVLLNEVSGMSGCRGGKFSSSTEVGFHLSWLLNYLLCFPLMVTMWLPQLPTAQQDLKQENPVSGRSVLLQDPT